MAKTAYFTRDLFRFLQDLKQNNHRDWFQMFHLRLEPDNSSVGAGIWRREPRALKRIRDAIAEEPKK